MSFSLFRRFQNPPGGPRRNYNLFKWLAFFMRRMGDKAPRLPDHFIIPQQEALQRYHEMQNANTLTWLGHSTFLIKMNGRIILTDPFLTEYASPFSRFGPKRFTPPGFALSNLPLIDIIVVSHDHYDHLDVRTIASIPGKSAIEIVAPLRYSDIFKKLGFENIHELTWYQSWSYEGITIRALPAYHYSKRHLLTRNTRWWASYAITWQDKQLYFSGDTAYGSIFLDLGRDYGPFDYALLSIGAYDPPQLMLAGHISPELAVSIGQELRAKTLVAMHWGAIILSDEPPFEPVERFLQAATSVHYPPDAIWIMKIGETRKI